MNRHTFEGWDTKNRKQGYKKRKPNFKKTKWFKKRVNEVMENGFGVYKTKPNSIKHAEEIVLTEMERQYQKKQNRIDLNKNKKEKKKKKRKRKQKRNVS
tara:strand:- start:311 stop:607 length:297 start_codon:yes stop_codon:yes gene_type:complete